MATFRVQEKASRSDWHPADIVAALRKAGVSMRGLSRKHGYAHETAISTALHRRWPKAERIIADAIGTRPEVIWPSRYQSSKPRRAA